MEGTHSYEDGNLFNVGDIVALNFSGVYIGRIIECIGLQCMSMNLEYVIKILGDGAPMYGYNIRKYRPWYSRKGHTYTDAECYSILEEDDSMEGSNKISKVLAKIVCLPEKKLMFSIQRRDINRFNKPMTDGDKFKIMLRGLWKDLVVRKIEGVITKEKDILSVHKITIDNEGCLHNEMEGLVGLNGTKTHEDEDKALYENSYDHFFGFASSWKTSKHDNCNGKIYFQQNKYNSFDFNIHKTGYFGDIGNFTCGYISPLKGQYICGIVEKGPKGFFYKKWFSCSPQFVNFWSFLMSNRTPDINALLKSVDTRCYSVFDNFKDIKSMAMERNNILPLVTKSISDYDEIPYSTLINFIILQKYPEKGHEETIYNISGIKILPYYEKNHPYFKISCENHKKYHLDYIEFTKKALIEKKIPLKFIYIIFTNKNDDKFGDMFHHTENNRIEESLGWYDRVLMVYEETYRDIIILTCVDIRNLNKIKRYLDMEYFGFDNYEKALNNVM